MNGKDGIEYQTNRLTFAPLLPSGSLIYSALVLAHRFGGYSTHLKTRMRFCQTNSIGPISKFGAGARNFLQGFFADALPPEQIFRKHTLYGFYSLGLSNSSASEWATHLAGGSMQSLAYYTRQVRFGGADKGLRWCPACATADQINFGFSAWRVVHQLPFLQLCHEHNLPLCISCKVCKKPLDSGTEYRLPGESCSECGSSHFEDFPSSVSDGYRTLHSVSERIFNTQSDEFRPGNWEKRIAKFLARHRSRQAAEQLVEEKICTKWCVKTPTQITECPTDFVEKNFVTKLLGEEKKNYSLVSRIIIGDALSDA